MAIDEEIRALLKHADPVLQPFYGMMLYHLGLDAESARGGKRLRPMLCALVFEALGGDSARVLPAGAALELLHNFTLIHDDIEDQDPRRHHRPTVWSVWGEAQAINAGDGMYAVSRFAIQRLRERGFSAERILDVSALLDRTCIRVCEGQFLDIKHEDQRLRVQWKVPIFGSSHDLISWTLDEDANTLAAFGRVPVRSLADFRIGSGGKPKGNGDDKKRKIVQAFSLDAIDVALSLLAPRSLEVGGGVIMFGGDDQPGMVDLKATGAINDKGPGSLKGAIGSIDTTIKDLRMGPVVLTADRLHFDGIEHLEVTFDGFGVQQIAVIVHRVTAQNFHLQIGRGG